jgi:hydroxyacylglutathione hydrolase
VFVGDTLFSVGCGKLLEGDAKTMWASLSKLAKLPPETKLYCGHEYTDKNCRFALTVEPENDALRARASEVAALSETGEATLPTTIKQELATNPFLRPSSPAIQKRLGMEGKPLSEIFGEIRRRKDRF